ncbi:MAG: leucine-rich repeat protein [Bacteroidales bacterium]|nr:leucine-rich repeat protein [Bacteroidales bacterium]
MQEFCETSQSGAITGSLDALSSTFSGHEPMPTRSRQAGNVLYRARRWGRYYVLKGLAPEHRNNPAMREFLSKEYQIGVQLDHPHIVRVNSLEEDPKAGLCIVMEYVDGQNLDEWLATKPAAAARKRIFRQILDAMAYCHDRQIWHLDLKPSNILITKDGLTAKVIDFGLSDNSSFAFRQTGGTRKYAAPEQLAGLGGDHRSDIYALGGLLKRMFPHRYGRAVRHAQRTDPGMRPQTVQALSKLVRPRWWLWLLPVLLVGLLCLWMRPDGKRFPVTLESGQTVYAKVLSHWHRTVAFVTPNEAKSWHDMPNAPSGDMVIPSHIRCRGIRYRVTELDSCAFRDCVDLTHLVLVNGLQRIGERAFAGDNRIGDTIIIPYSLKVLESNVFADCHSLTTLIWKALDCNTGYFPNQHDRFFYRCSSMKRAIIDDSVTVLPPRLFNDMGWLEEIVLPNHIRELSRDFAASTYNLRGCRLPDSLCNINHGAFYSSNIEQIVIPDKTEVLGSYSLSYCRELRKVEIGSGVKRIESYAFNDNTALQAVIIHCDEPPTTLPNALNDIPDNAVLYVPAQSVEKYRKHEEWGKFRRIEPIDDIPQAAPLGARAR